MDNVANSASSLQGRKLGWGFVFWCVGGALISGTHGKRGWWDFSSSGFYGKAFMSESPSLGIYCQCASRYDLSCKELYFCVRNESTITIKVFQETVF
jgi:hypothetical protein